ncbi:MAG: hypothetical protein HQL65_10625 [Magnetococcales bacterium]|nr:hypothetical protein [Magnetococcales bacterium]
MHETTLFSENYNRLLRPPQGKKSPGNFFAQNSSNIEDTENIESYGSVWTYQLSGRNHAMCNLSQIHFSIDTSEKIIIFNDKLDINLTYPGALHTTARIRYIKVDSALVLSDHSPTINSKCFVDIDMESDHLYSRGHVLNNLPSGTLIYLENGFRIFEFFTRQVIDSKNNLLEKIIVSKKLKQFSNNPEKTDEKINCWEFNQCGKEEYCLAGTSDSFDGFFGGKNGGRFCAFIEGTLCKDDTPRRDSDKLKMCSHCPFYEILLKDVA